MVKKRINVALFGGSFDPFHNGHLAILKSLQELDFLSYILVVPAKLSPQKEGHRFSPEARLEMVRKVALSELAMAPPIIVSDMEIVRGGSYTMDTVREIQARYKPDQIYLVLGSDTYKELSTWHEADALIEAVKLIVIDRKTIPVSSSEVREKLERGESVSDLVPKSVLDSIL